MSMNEYPQPSGYFGPYRGVVTNNVDPAGQNRIKAIVPQIFGNASTETDWALPMAPLGSNIVVPAPTTGVWIQFEGGDLNYPVYTGVWHVPFIPPVQALYASLTGTGETNPTGSLTQAGGFTVNDNTATGLILQTNGGGVIIKDSTTGGVQVVSSNGGYLGSSSGGTSWTDSSGSGYTVTESGSGGVNLTNTGIGGINLTDTNGTGGITLTTPGRVVGSLTGNPAGKMVNTTNISLSGNAQVTSMSASSSGGYLHGGMTFSSNALVAPRTGVYHISFQVLFIKFSANVVDSGFYNVYALANGSTNLAQASGYVYTSGVVIPSFGTSCDYNLQAGDSVALWQNNNASGNLSDPGVSSTYLSMHLVSE